MNLQEKPRDSKPVRVSVVIPAYMSKETISQSLGSMTQQDYPDYELIVVDSSPRKELIDIIEHSFPTARYHYNTHRLLPHMARNLGAKLAQGDLLLFTDPDIYVATDWISRMVWTCQNGNRMVLGAMKWFGDRWLDRGIHFSKFASYLPAGRPREINVGYSGCFLCSKQHFKLLGGYQGDVWCGDTLFTEKAQSHGIEVLFDPNIIVWHIHTSTFWKFLRERYYRGREIAMKRALVDEYARRQIWLKLGLTVFLVRLVYKIIFLIKQAKKSYCLRDCIQTIPVWLAGEMAWLAGQAVGYTGILKGEKAKSSMM